MVIISRLNESKTGCSVFYNVDVTQKRIKITQEYVATKSYLQCGTEISQTHQNYNKTGLGKLVFLVFVSGQIESWSSVS